MVLYNNSDKTITYNGRKFKIYKQTIKAIENNFKIFKCISYRHLEAKLKGKNHFCYASIWFYDNSNP